MRLALGERGARLIALGIVISTLRLPGAGDPDRAARLLRDGAGRHLLQGGRRAAPEEPRAGARDRAAGAGRVGDRGLGPLRADPELRGLGRLHLLRPHRRGPLRASAPRRAGALPRARPPRDDGLLRALVLGRRGRDDPPLPEGQRDRPRDPGARPAGLRPLVARGGPRERALSRSTWSGPRPARRRASTWRRAGSPTTRSSVLGPGLERPSRSATATTATRRSRSVWRARPASIPTASCTRPAPRWPTCWCWRRSPRPGDEVLIEEPTYTLLADAARWLRLDVRRFPRRFEAGFRIDPRDVERALTPAHPARRAHEPAQSLERVRAARGPAPDRRRRALARRARAGGRGLPRVRTRCSAGRGARRRGSATSSSPPRASPRRTASRALRCGWIVAEPDLARRMWRLNDLFGVIPAHPAERLSVLALDRLDRIAARARRILRAQHRGLATPSSRPAPSSPASPSTAG